MAKADNLYGESKRSNTMLVLANGFADDKISIYGPKRDQRFDLTLPPNPRSGRIAGFIVVRLVIGLVLIVQSTNVVHMSSKLHGQTLA